MLSNKDYEDDDKATIASEEGVGHCEEEVQSQSVSSEENACNVEKDSCDDKSKHMYNAAGSTAYTSSEKTDRVRSLLNHIKAEIKDQQTNPAEQGTSGPSAGGRISVDLSTEDVMLLTDLLERGQIDRTSKLGRSLTSAMREMTMITHAGLIQRHQGDGHWPVHVAFRDLNYAVTVPKTNPGIMNAINAMWAPCAQSSQESFDFNIINKLSGVFKAGTSTLVLGPPGCGVSTLFKLLSGRIRTSGRAKVTGDLFYSGFHPEDLHVRKLATYVDQNDNHIPVLTVRETLQFAYDCFGGPEEARMMIDKFGLAGDVSDRDIVKIHEEFDNFPDFVIRNLALSNAADTIVGNELLRGVSGGEKKRVTSAEMMMARRPLAFYDQISTGLDSSATFDITRRITGVARRLELTAVCALLQPPPETYNLFDEILILALGMTVYHGKRENVLPYFESIGFACPENLDVADFIQEVTTSDRVKHMTRSDAPRNEHELAQAWIKSPYSQAKQEEVERYCTPENKIDSPMRRDVYDRFQPLYANSCCKDLALVVGRQLTLSFRDVAFVQTRALQALGVGVFIGSLFYKIDPNLPASASDDQQPALQRYGIFFATMIHCALAGAAQIPVVLMQRPVYYKQSDAYFYRTGNYVIAELCSVLPLAFIESTLLAVLTFFIGWIVPFKDQAPTGETDVGGPFMLYWLILLILNISFGTWLRAVASFSPSQPIGQVLMGISVASVCLFSGYLITADTVPVWFVWIFWLSPLAWAFRAGVIVIFGSSAFTEAQRDYTLALFGFEYDVNYIYGGILLMVAYTLVGMYISHHSYIQLRYEGGGGRALEDVEEDEAFARHSEIRLAADAHSGQPGKSPAGTASHPHAKDETSNAISFTPVDLVFRNLWYSVQGPKDGGGEFSLSLLKGISGYAEAGTLTALMGSSGAGKTTLMDVLALRKTSGKITGDVLVNGRPQERTTFSRIIGYVEQMDIHSPKATVHEALTFSAYLRQPSHISNEEKDEFVEGVMKTLQLHPLRDMMIGFKHLGGLSTEQAKRLTIGVELAANPAIIFADEPTSGLDASSARVVMDGLERIARGGRTVVCTIHQPSKFIFEKFDRLLLLRRGGQMVYFGDLGENSSELLTYLDALPGTPGMPNPRYNPATYMLEAIGANAGAGNDYAAEYENSAIRQHNEQAIETLVQRNLAERPEIHFETTFASTFGMQTDQLVKRWMLSYWRDVAYNTSRFFLSVFMAVFFGFSFLLRGGDITSSADVQTFVGAMFQATSFMAVMGMATVMPVIYVERASYYRERAASYYGVIPVVIATTLAELPYCVGTGLVFCPIFYFMVGMYHNASAFFLFFAFYIMFYFCIIFFGHMLAQALPNEQVASLIGSVFFACWCISSGLMISVDQVPYFWTWFTYINPLRYCIQGLVSSQMACDDPSIEPAENPGCNWIEESNSTAWEFMENRFGYVSSDWPWCLGAVIAFAGGFRIVNAFCYAYVSYLKR